MRVEQVVNKIRELWWKADLFDRTPVKWSLDSEGQPLRNGDIPSTRSYVETSKVLIDKAVLETLVQDLNGAYVKLTLMLEENKKLHDRVGQDWNTIEEMATENERLENKALGYDRVKHVLETAITESSIPYNVRDVISQIERALNDE
jgi:hypothetical protein